MFDKILAYLKKNPFDLDFDDNSYNSESLFLESIKSDFAGWCDPSEIKKQIDFILFNCPANNKYSILDVACGHGKHSIELASRGYKVIGIDISEALIAHLNTKAKNGTCFYKKRMSEINELNKYGLIIVLGNSLALMPIDECKKSLQKIFEAMQTNGNIFLQIDNKKIFIEKEANTKNWDFHQNRWLNIAEHYFDIKRSLEITREIGFDLTEKTVNEFVGVKRLYELDEFINILKTIGFLEIEYWGDWDKSFFKEESPTLLIKAKKIEEGCAPERQKIPHPTDAQHSL